MKHLEREMISKERDTFVKLCQWMLSHGKHHIAMENLDNSFGKSFSRNEEFENLKYNRLLKFIHISSLKDEIKHIAENYNICVSTVHAEYTSQQCSICGSIHEENRKTQEVFSCLDNESHIMNADRNAARNIYLRLSNAVLRNNLLQKCKENSGEGVLKPKDIEHSKIKDLLLRFRCEVYGNAINQDKFL